MKNLFSDAITNIKQSRLGKRIALLIILFSSAFTLLSTGLQLALDYKADISRIEQQFNNIQSSYLQTITLSVWAINDYQIQTQLRGLSQLPDIEQAVITIDGNVAWQEGDRRSTNFKQAEFDLVYSSDHIAQQQVGVLTVSASIDNVYQRLLHKAWLILVSNGIKTFIVSGFILFLIGTLITRHLQAISSYVHQLNLERLSQPLVLNKSTSATKLDEIDEVCFTLNDMTKSLHHSYQEISEAKDHLHRLVEQRDQLLASDRLYRENLEDLVLQRTQQLENSLEELKSTQSRLVETEKMAALGNMVAGIAHEINTPIGVCRTAASFQHESSQAVRQKVSQGTLTERDFFSFLNEVDEASEMFEANISRACTLISNFKQIAVDQSYDTRQHFNCKDYLLSSIETLSPQYKHQGVSFNLLADGDIELNSYPGAFHQIISNLIQNSVIHGFEDTAGGKIDILVESDGQTLSLTYKDDGKGLDEQQRTKIFEPFFTTKRGQGGSGLGMSIVYNTVTAKLRGQIEVVDTPPSEGFEVRIQVPLEVVD